MSNLKITDIETIFLCYRYTDKEIWKWSGGKKFQRNTILVRIFTDQGIQGIGEVGIGDSCLFQALVEAAVNDHFKPLLVGEDPFRTEYLWEKMYTRSLPWSRRGLLIPIISGIDIALWDIMGKALNVPTYELLGGLCREKVRLYASAGMSQSVDELIKEIKSYLDQGFSAIKIRIGSDPKSDVERVKAVRKGIGYDVDLMVDAGQTYTDSPWDYNAAYYVSKKLEECELFWLEEPCGPDDIDCYSRLTSNTSTPIAGGENEFTRHGFKDLIVNRAVDYLQPDVTRTGGISEVKKISALAMVFHMKCAPHIFMSGVSLMANLHVIASTPNAVIMEYDRTINPLRDRLLHQSLRVENGYLYLDQTVPGLGLHLDDDITKQFAFKPGIAVKKPPFSL